MLSRIVLLCAVATLAGGCGGDEGGGPEILASFYPVAYAASQVAPEGMSVVDLTPTGAEPHDLELTARDVARIQEAAHVVYAGGGFQPAVEDALEGRSGSSTDVLHGTPGQEPVSDPHVWLDPVRYAAVARTIANELGNPRGADELVSRLEALDAEYRRGLARCGHRRIVTSHAAFGHLAARYGLEQVALVGLAPEAEPSARELERFVEEVRASGATTVFSEPLTSSRLAETVAREAGVETAVLNPLEGLTGEQVEAGADYFDVMRENLAALRRALGCT